MDTILLFMLPAGLWAQDAGVAATTAAPDATAGALGELATGLNTVWMLLAAMLVFFMQPGFALVEAGFIRTKNTANVLMKNLVDFMFGSILFWFIGFGLMFGIGGFVGAPHFFNLEAMDKIIDNGLPIEGFLIFQTVFCATAGPRGPMAATVFSAPGRPPSCPEPWRNVPGSPCIWSILSLSAYSFIRFPATGPGAADG